MHTRTIKRIELARDFFAGIGYGAAMLVAGVALGRLMIVLFPP